MKKTLQGERKTLQRGKNILQGERNTLQREKNTLQGGTKDIHYACFETKRRYRSACNQGVLVEYTFYRRVYLVAILHTALSSNPGRHRCLTAY